MAAIMLTLTGELSEWSMVTDLKSVGCHSPRGSNPLLSARPYSGRLPLRGAAPSFNDTTLLLTETGFIADMHY